MLDNINNSIQLKLVTDFKRLTPNQYAQLGNFYWAMRLSENKDEIEDNLWYYQHLFEGNIIKFGKSKY